MEDRKIVLRLWLIDASHITHGDPRYGDPRRLMLCIYTYLRIYPCGCQPKTRWQVFPPDFIPFQLVSRNMLQKTSENIPYFQKIYEDLWRSTWSSMKQIFSPELPWPSQPFTRMPERVIDELQRMPPGASAPSHQYYRATLVQSDLIGFTSTLAAAVGTTRITSCGEMKWPDFGTWITYDNLAFVPIARNDC